MSALAGRSVLVAINVPPALEERVIDWLLARDPEAGYTMYAARGHGAPARQLTITEQVHGYQHRLEMRIELPEASLDEFLGALTQDFARADLYYQVVPVLRSGKLGDAAGNDG